MIALSDGMQTLCLNQRIIIMNERTTVLYNAYESLEYSLKQFVDMRCILLI